MPKRVTVKDIERMLIGMSGNVFLYREGINEFFLSHSFAGAREELAAVRGKLDALGMYEACQRALSEAERLVRLGPQFDEEAYSLLADTAKDLMQASGTWESMSRRFSPANDPNIEG